MVSVCRFIGGLAISTLGGLIFIRPLLWALRHYARVPKHESLRGPNAQRGLSWATGIVEGGLYMCALVVGAYQWIGIWLAIKVAARWKSAETTDNSIQIWLIGSGISVLFGFLGAWFALWPNLPKIR